MTLDILLSALVTLLVTVDPIGLAPIFLSLTHGMTAEQRNHVGLRATLIAFGVLSFFALAGEHLLHWLGIELPAFRLGGGILLFWIAFEMVFAQRTERKRGSAESAVTLDHIRDLAAFPLAIPLMAGPGAITAVILLSSRVEGSIAGRLTLIGLVAAVMAACLAVFVMAGRISRLLGVTGSTVLSRLLGVLLTGLAVQFVVDGIKGLFRV